MSNKFLKRNGLYFSAIALLAVLAMGLFLLSDSTTASAQKGETSRRGENSRGSVARADHLAYALNMRSANDQTVFGQKGIKGDGSFTGRSATGSDANLAGGLSGVKVRSDLTKSFSAINQLPCVELEGEFTGGTFAPGVYCASSANLSGNMTLDGEGIYVFRVDGKMKTAEDFTMTMNGAKGGSVYFVAGDTASIAANNTVEGTIIARNTVDVGAGATVKGRVQSVNSEVILGTSSNVVLQTGVIEICKEALTADDIGVRPTADTLGNRIFGFLVNGVTYFAPVGGCTGPITIADNTPTTIEELNTGTYTDRPGTWINRFRLVSVTEAGPGSIVPGTINLPARTVQVTVPDSTIANQTVVTFTNTFAIPAVIEICKHALDVDVTGFFDFTVDAIANQVFTVPVGGCSGAIQVLVPATPGGVPQQSLIRVTEIGRDGFTLESASTFPSSATVADSTIVSPTNLEGWQTQVSGGAAVNFENGPGTPPLGTGSVEFRVGPNGADAAQLRHPGYQGVELADLTALNYFTYVDQDGSGGQAPYIILQIDLDGNLGTTGDRHLIFFEPVYQTGVFCPSNPQPALALQTWQSWNALGGCWWSPTAIAGATPGAGVKPLSVIIAAFPNAVIYNSTPSGLGGVRLVTGFGAGAWDNFIGNADAFAIGVNGVTTTYNFEASGASTTFLQLGVGILNTTECSVFPEGTAVPPACFFSNPGGGVVTAIVTEGNTSNQTTINFFNRTNPGIVKVCKIAGPGVPIGAEFDFIVQGTVASPTVPFTPGSVQNRRVRVQAGPDNINGGFCEFVRNPDGSLTRFIVGTPVYVREFDYVEGTGQTPIVLPSDGSIRVGRIRLDLGAAGTGFIQADLPTTNVLETYDPPQTPAAGFALGPIDNTGNPGTSNNAHATFIQRRGTREIEFVNFVFQPTLLKVCKIAGAGVTEGTVFNFNVTIGTFGGLVPQPGTTPIPVSVQAGPADSGGFCVFVPGPYPVTNTNPPVGTFPVGFPVTVTEGTAAGTVISAITTPTGPAANFTADIPNRRGTLVLGFPGGFNEIVFTNAAAAPVQTGFAISGRVMTPEGGGLRNAQVILVGADGSRFAVPTSSMGYYSFEGLSSQAYRVSVTSRRYRFEARDIELNSSLSAFDFTGIE